MSKSGRILAGALALVAWPSLSPAAELDLEGEFWVDGRAFLQAPQWLEQDERRVQPSVALTGGLTLSFDGGADVLRLVPFGRIDPTVTDRSHWDIREAYYLHKDDGFDVLIGASRVFWGVTESRHLVNIINQSDYLEDIDGEDYLGQPMVNVNLFGDWGTLDLYAMTGFRERQFPNQDGRYSLPINIDEDEARFDSDLEIWQPDLAVRFRTTVDNWDFGLSHFYGTSREPTFGFELEGAAENLPPAVKAQIESLQLGSLGTLGDFEDALAGTGISTAQAFDFLDNFLALAPIYDVINQTGIEALGVYDDLILKFEGVTITGHGGDRIWAFVAGFEYTLSNVAESGMDVGLLSEFIWDNRDIGDGPYTVLDNDIFAGVRVAFNNQDSTSLLLGGYVDVELGSTILTAELESRIDDNLKLSIEARGYPFVSQDDPLAYFEKDSYVQVRFSFFF
jgi:hypothetical protein